MPCYNRGTRGGVCTRKQRRRRRTAAAVALLVFGSSVGAVHGFAGPQHAPRVATRRNYVEDTVALNTQEMLETALHQQPQLPTWLRQPRAHLYEQNISKLRDSMLKSFFSENETLKLIYAIQEASGGDRNKMAGAAEFSLILVETMEIGLDTLLAAAFHYCSCVNAREQSLLLHPTASPSDVWDQQDHPGLLSFGQDAVAISRDAASLKRLEMVAADIMQSPRESARAAPDAHDSENLQRLLMTESKDWRAMAIRSAACLYRMRGISAALTPGEVSPEAVRVAREALKIFAPLASRLGMYRLKNELEGTAFKLLYPRQYNAVTIDSTIKDSMKQVLDEATEDVRQILRDDPEFSSMAEHVSVAARVKEPYSMWKKMLRDNKYHVRQVPDALALRIVFDAKKDTADEEIELTRAKERALCYYLRELCMERFKPQPGDARLKDYIATPKPNGYQSLHYTAVTNWGGEDWTMEIQIRSGEMHKVAEYGLASHWDYKAQGTKGEDDQTESFTDNSSDAYLRSLQEWHWQQQTVTKQSGDVNSTPEPSFLSDEAQGKIRADRIRARTERLAPYIEALSEAQSNMSLEHVFVFLSHPQGAEGKVLSLPAGACVIDALREAEKTLGLRLNLRGEQTFVSHNGSEAIATQKLKNGDILTVPQMSVQHA